MSHNPNHRRAGVSNKEGGGGERGEPFSVNKDSVKRQYCRKVKEPESVSLQDNENAFSENKTRSRSALPQFKDTEDSDPDNLLHCPECGAKWGGNCPLHGFLHFVSDVFVPRHRNNTLRAELTTPYVVNIRTLLTGETIVAARMPIPIRTRFGPYEGQLTTLEDASEHAWLIRRNGKPDHCIDALEPGFSNWMRFVRDAPEKGKANLLAYQYYGKLYYMTIRNIFPEEELLVWCGSKYKQTLDEEQGSLSEPAIAADTTRKVKEEVLDTEDVADDTMRDGMISENVMVNRNAVKTEVFDDFLFEDVRVRVKRERDVDEGGHLLSVDDKVNKQDDVEEMRKKIKVEVNEDDRYDTSFIKEEVESDGGEDLTREVRDDQNERSDQHVVKSEFASSTDVNSSSGIAGFAENASTNRYDASFTIPPAASEGAITVEPPLERNAESIADLCSEEVSTEIHSEAQPNKNSLTEHLSSHAGDKKSVHNPVTSLNKRQQNNTKPGSLYRYICTYRNCFLHFTTRFKYRNYVLKYKSRKAVRCPKCLKELDSQANLNDHLQRTVCGYLPYICTNCNMAFKEHAKLGDHTCLGDTRNSGDVAPVNSANEQTTNYLCSECNLHYETKRELYKHFRLSHIPEKFCFCNYCKKRYSSNDVLDKHIRRVHSKEKPYVCTVCNKNFFESVDLKRHSAVHSKTKPYSKTCVVCFKKYFNSEDEFRKHFSSHLTCRLCDRQYNSYPELQQHIRLEHREAKLFECSDCKERFPFYLELEKHMRFHAQEKSLLDEVGDAPIAETESYAQEKCLLNEASDTPIAETESDAQEKSLLDEESDVLLVETESHETLTLFDDMDSEWTTKKKECSNCDGVFSTDIALFNHVCVMLRRGDQFGSKSRSQESNTSVNREQNQKERPYLCVECNGDFSCQSLLDEHQCSGHNERPIACLECVRWFWSEDAYKTHLRSHLVEKPHVCCECAERFARLEQLELHLKTHSKDIPFTCVECDPALYEKYRLNRQFETQCDDTNVTCIQCDRTYSRDSITEQVSQDHPPFEFVSCGPE